MENVPQPDAAATVRVSQAITTDLLQRGASIREAIALGELILATRYIRRHQPDVEHKQLAGFLGISRATYYRRRDRVAELTGEPAERYDVDVSAMAPPPLVAAGIFKLA